MRDNKNKEITNIVNAFRLINKDIAEAIKSMRDKLKADNIFKEWKKKKNGNKRAKGDYWDYTDLITGDSEWYYLNCYGTYYDKVIGFTFVVSVDYMEDTDTNYLEIINKLDKNINKNSPMLCICGIYTPINDTKEMNFEKDNQQYVDDILQFTDNLQNDYIEKIKYEEWIDVEVKYKNDDGSTIDGFKEWYKSAKIKIVNITDVSSKEKAVEIIDDLVKAI